MICYRGDKVTPSCRETVNLNGNIHLSLDGFLSKRRGFPTRVGFPCGFRIAGEAVAVAAEAGAWVSHFIES